MAARRQQRPARIPTYARPPSARVIGGTQSLPDCSRTFIRSYDWLAEEGRDQPATAELRAEQLVQNNLGILRELGVSAHPTRHRGEAGLLFETSARVGAIPLISPVSGRPDFGLVVEPRFSWSSAGEVLAATGMKVLPELLPVPDLPRSNRRVPPWVLSSVILQRLKALTDSMRRSFVMVDDVRRAPRGQVDWGRYAAFFAEGRPVDVPCRFPDLIEDEDLRAAVHWVLLRHRDALLAQLSAGAVVRELLALCEELLVRVRSTPPRVPSERLRRFWTRVPLSLRVFREGLEAMNWTFDERGLAGLSELSGLSWRMDMEVFFESWVETIAEACAARTGSRVRSGRLSQTKVPLDWMPAGSGSQRALIPDVVIERDDFVMVLDAKYKRHAEEIGRIGWSNVSDELREQHRADVLQALAYSTLFDKPRTIACLVYPTTLSSWRALKERGRTLARATVRASSRRVELALLAVPLCGQRDELSHELLSLTSSAINVTDSTA